MTRLMSAYPLLVKDPYYSFWLNGERLNKAAVIHWGGMKKTFLGLLKVDGTVYCFLGLQEQAIELEQTGIEVGLFNTKFSFVNDLFSFEVNFISPLLITDLNILSNPSCYVEYEFTSEKTFENVEVSLFLHENIAYQNKGNMRGDVLKLKDYEVSYFGKDKQDILSHSVDVSCADWGYYYLTGQSCDFVTKNGETLITAKNTHQASRVIRDKFIVAFDDVCSIFYFGEFLRGYYFDDPRITIFHAIEDAFYNMETVLSKCSQFEKKVFAEIGEFGEDYKNILISSYRQSIGSHKLVKDKLGRILFLSKENGSGGCIATADVSFPSSPLFLAYNPILVYGMLQPIIDFARMDVWEYDFAPHDCGVYPYCLGQFYAVYNKEGKYQKLITFLEDDVGVLPRYYTYPKGQNIYNFNKQMPVEECGNILILSYLVYKELKDESFIRENFDLFEKWANYLLGVSTFPFNQLCTDDFAGQSKGNVNLAIKAAVGLACFGKICDLLGKESRKHHASAKARAKEIANLARNGYLPLHAGDESDTFSLKYNLYADIVCGTDLFSDELKENELSYYLRQLNRYGCPLDSRVDYSKTDWLVWCSTFTTDYEKRKRLYKHINNFIRETPDRFPFVDWYDTKTGEAIKHTRENRIFTNRSVQGGCFAPLYDKLRQK